MSFPNRVTLEFTNNCLERCPECPRHKTDMQIGYMNRNLFYKIIKELPGNTTVVPFFRGESTLHPEFCEFMRALNVFKNVQFASNGKHLSKDMQMEILDCCTFFSLSLHTFMLPEECDHTNFLYYLGKKKVTTQVSIVDCNLPKYRSEGFIKQWLKHVDVVRVYREHSLLSLGDIENVVPPTEPCGKVFSDMIVYWDGKVGLCNHDWNNQTLHGDLNRQSIEDVWNGKEYKVVRASHLAGQRRSVPTCRDCCFSNHKVYGQKIIR